MSTPLTAEDNWDLIAAECENPKFADPDYDFDPEDAE